MPYAIYNNDIRVGFIMLLCNKSGESDDENAYWIYRNCIGGSR